MNHGRFRRIRLLTKNLEQMHTFYAETLELPIRVDNKKKKLTVIVGESELEFVEESTESRCYHFAINIPNNMFAEAKRWLALRTKLLLDSEVGTDQRFFANWNAHAVYFSDPDGNIGELIARHTLPICRAGVFGPDKMLHISEIGLPSPNPDELADQLMKQYDLSMYGDSSFAIGDEYGLFILPEVDRPWIPERRHLAAIYSTAIDLRGQGGKLMPSRLPFVVETSD
ncbi:MAG: hypothetical protein GKR89_26945 [Candidatus Latescibacteria bacterium]|nr:hypothetical protein [Candidatus Latescibacterota bacterium]